ncbi:sensor histidine kinase [Paenibacillus wynnii]|uniref:sensor histidine kinase n=1 Tax=Paenibacillus wynnii TaxID=268407 RepID=UPI0027905B01|nr:HAMP domain-containing sensor histidine kinase [Paenibacillus wynnii]MDQ0193358.1 signal transduction histidine kinase [Paenibacillus wynnii]
MIKSLYVRVVLTFLGAIFISGAIAALLINSLYIGQIKTMVQNDMIESGKIIIKAYQDEKGQNLDSLMKGVSSLPLYSVRLYDNEGKQLYTSRKEISEQESRDEANIQSVLQGGVFRSQLNKGKKEGLTVGIPFSIDGSPRALFISPEISELLNKVGNFMRSQLLIVLGCGSILILLAARYIVLPLQQLTRATRRMAKGDFSVSLHTKRNDEIGQLTRSFNVMAQELGTLEGIRKQFVSDVSHEFQSPLTSIKGFTQALKRKDMDEASRLRLLNIIEEESDRLSRLCGDLLQLSTLEYEHLQLVPESFSLDEQLRKIVIALEPQWSAKKVNLELELPSITIVADEDRLSQIWSNLLSNSIKFTGEDGLISITAIEQEDQVRIQIADTGVGMPEEEIRNIFKPFYKVDKARSREVGGSGIGLSIVKRVVDLHHGHIEVTSALRKGTTVTVQLPLNYSTPES